MLQPLQIFTARDFETLVSCTGTLGCTVCLTPQLFLPVYLHVNVGPPCLPATTLPTPVLQLLPCCESSAQLPISAPPTGLDECFLFNSLVIGLPYSSVVWQFWFFVFKFVIFLLVFRGGTACLPTLPSSILLIFKEGHGKC